ncbi:unnamed protein product, partial [Amoebophrya sp. A25]
TVSASASLHEESKQESKQKMQKPPQKKKGGAQPGNQPWNNKNKTPSTRTQQGQGPQGGAPGGNKTSKEAKLLQRGLQHRLNEACQEKDAEKIRDCYQAWFTSTEVTSRPTCLFAQTMQGLLSCEMTSSTSKQGEVTATEIEEIFLAGTKYVNVTESLLFLILRAFTAFAHQDDGNPLKDTKNTSREAEEAKAGLDKALGYFRQYAAAPSNSINKQSTSSRTTTIDKVKDQSSRGGAVQLKLRTCIPLLQGMAALGDTVGAESFFLSEIAPRFLSCDDMSRSDATAALVMGSVTRNSSIQITDDQHNWEQVFLLRLEALRNHRTRSRAPEGDAQLETSCNYSNKEK